MEFICNAYFLIKGTIKDMKELSQYVNKQEGPVHGNCNIILRVFLCVCICCLIWKKNVITIKISVQQKGKMDEGSLPAFLAFSVPLGGRFYWATRWPPTREDLPPAVNVSPQPSVLG